MHLYLVTFSYEAHYHVVAEDEGKALELAREKLKDDGCGAVGNYDFESLTMLDKNPLIQPFTRSEVGLK